MESKGEKRWSKNGEKWWQVEGARRLTVFWSIGAIKTKEEENDWR